MPNTITAVPGDLIALELIRRIEVTIADSYGKDTCRYQADLAGRKVAAHAWLAQHPGTSPERRAARKALRAAADQYTITYDQAANSLRIRGTAPADAGEDVIDDIARVLMAVEVMQVDAGRRITAFEHGTVEAGQ